MTLPATLMINGRKQFLSANGAPLVGGKVYYYTPATTTFKTTWQDNARVTSNTNPITLDAFGSCLVYGSGTYREYVTDSQGNLIQDALTSDTDTTTAVSYSVLDFGAKGDGTTDDTASIQAAINAFPSGATIVFPPGIYKTSATLTIPSSGITLSGAGISATSIKSAVANIPVITMSGFITGVSINNMTLDRSVTATSGGNGISNIISSQFCTLSNLVVQNQYVGVALGPTGYSYVGNVISQKNQSHGFLINNTAASGACQWSFSNCLAAQNGGDGFHISSANTGPSAMALGELLNCATFANTGIGVAAIGVSGCPINGLRVTGGFFGQDGNHEVYLDTFGGLHKLVGVFTELAGTGPTGPTLVTSASHIGGGFKLTANNTDVQINDSIADGHSQSGFISSATELTTSGCKAINNGAAAISGDQAGFKIDAGRLFAGNSRSGNVGGSTPQQYGFQFTTGASGHGICGADCTGNGTQSINVLASFTDTMIVGVVPSGNVIIPGAGIEVGIATGGTAPGTINVATAVQLNGVAFTNP